MLFSNELYMFCLLYTSKSIVTEMWLDLFLQKSVLNNSEIFLLFPDIIYQNPDFLCHIVKAPREHRNLCLLYTSRCV